jgi:hypothetical protein
VEAGRGNFSGLPGRQGVGESAAGSLFLGAKALHPALGYRPFRSVFSSQY